MTIECMIELLEIEHECMLRNSHGDCNRDCDKCDLVQADDELHEMYTDVIAVLRERKPKEVHVVADINHIKTGYCPSCNLVISNITNPHFCGNCGQGVMWNAACGH